MVLYSIVLGEFVAAVARVGSWIKRNISLLFEFLTASVGITVFVASFFVPISNQTLVEITVALLALLAITSLLQRVTKIDGLETVLADVRRYLMSESSSANLERQLNEKKSSIEDRLCKVHSFLTEGALDAQLQDAALTTNATLQNFRSAGIAWAYESLGDVALVKEFSSASGSIRILSNWVGCLVELGEILAKKAREGCDVRILILRHDSEFAQLRSLELGWKDRNSVSRQIVAELEIFERLFRRHPDVRSSLRVKAFDARPPVCLFAYDGTRFMGNFWPKMNAMEGPFLRVLGGGTESGPAMLARIIDEQFELLWNDPKSLYVKLERGKPDYVTNCDIAWSQQES